MSKDCGAEPSGPDTYACGCPLETEFGIPVDAEGKIKVYFGGVSEESLQRVHDQWKELRNKYIKHDPFGGFTLNLPDDPLKGIREAFNPPKLKRPDWDQYFLDGARWVATRADCSRRQVGAMIVRDHRILATGYNGTLPGKPGCLDGACARASSDVEPGSQYDHGPGKCLSIHAEANALLWAAKTGVPVDGATMYLTDPPCETCERLSVQAGIVRFVYP